MAGCIKGTTAMLLILIYLVFSNPGVVLAAADSTFETVDCVEADGIVNCPVEVPLEHANDIQKPSSTSIDPTNTLPDTTFSTVTIEATRETPIATVVPRQTTDDGYPDPADVEAAHPIDKGLVNCQSNSTQIARATLWLGWIQPFCENLASMQDLPGAKGPVGNTEVQANAGVQVHLTARVKSKEHWDYLKSPDLCSKTFLAILDKCVEITQTYGGQVDTDAIYFNIYLQVPNQQKRDGVPSEVTNDILSTLATTNHPENGALVLRDPCEDGTDDLPEYNTINPYHPVDWDTIVCSPSGAEGLTFPRDQIHSAWLQDFCRPLSEFVQGHEAPYGAEQRNVHAGIRMYISARALDNDSWDYISYPAICVKAFMPLVDKCSPTGFFKGASYKDSGIDFEIYIEATGVHPDTPPKKYVRDTAPDASDQDVETPTGDLDGTMTCYDKQEQVSYTNVQRYFVEPFCKDIFKGFDNRLIDQSGLGATIHEIGVVMYLSIKPGANLEKNVVHYDQCILTFMATISWCSNEDLRLRTKGGFYESEGVRFNINWLNHTPPTKAVRGAASDSSGPIVARWDRQLGPNDTVTCYQENQADIDTGSIQLDSIEPFCKDLCGGKSGTSTVDQSGVGDTFNISGVVMYLSIKPGAEFEDVLVSYDECAEWFASIVLYCKDDEGSGRIRGGFWDNYWARYNLNLEVPKPIETGIFSMA